MKRDVDEKNIENEFLPLHGEHVNAPKFIPRDFEPHIAHEAAEFEGRSE
jgi:hypothetical protein